MKTHDNPTFYGFREKGDSSERTFGLEIVPGTKCQLSCANCYKRGSPTAGHAKGDMPADFVADCLRQARDAGFAEAVLLGGEPTLHPQLPEFVRLALELGLDPIVCTNGLRLAEPLYVGELVVPGLTLVMHAPVPADAAAVNDAHAGIRGYNERLHKAFDNIFAMDGVTVVGQMTVLEDFLPLIPGMFKWCLDNGVIPFVEMNRRHDSGNAYEGTVSPEQTLELFEQLRRIDPDPPSVLVPPAYGQPCTMAMTGLHVKNFGGGDHGQVFSCCGQQVAHGDLREQRLEEILTSSGLQAFRL